MSKIIKDEAILSDEFLFNTVKLHQLEEAVARLEGARIKHEAKLDVCYMLMKEAADGDEDAVKALAYSIKMTAKHVRQSIARKPRHAQMLKNIALDAKKVKDMKVGTYRALEPFATKYFEEF
ncbi:hypothetical protein HNO53_13065 [Billgrantia antri]|uniref:Uncharacterized protein n=1 Tax=Halomonas sulfidivorans TaxID=2733488 RepID=A0ABX7WHZ0_9GAMM|nr:hypothetical protein [Halomonas sulfidivorans]QTP59566.1 hypothetical protein HNO53_13065 [Halomonas sulfidivorans]